jgi:iron complex transport system ATP-binding protein
MGRATPPPLIDFHRLTMLRGDRVVLSDLALRVDQGEHLAVLGPNGSGKSTLIKAITRELHALPGGPGRRNAILGRTDWDNTELREHLGIVTPDLLQHLSHEITLREVTGLDMVLSGFFNSLGLWPHHRVTATQRRRARQLLRFLEIPHLARRPVSAMSSGERQRVLVGRALVHRPAALILDEPTNSLDPGAVHEFRRLLRKLARAGHSLILVTHHVSDIIPEIARVLLFQDGRIIADGSKRRLLTSPAMSRLFGARLRVQRRGANYELSSE